jgi:hypothetical protein
VVSVTRGHGKTGSDVTIRFLDPTFIWVVCLHLFFTCVFSFKSYSTFSFRLEIAIGSENSGGFWGILDPLVHAHINETPERHVNLRQTVSFESLAAERAESWVC